MMRVFFVLALSFGLVLQAKEFRKEDVVKFEKKAVSIANITIEVEIADTNERAERGLMFRTALGPKSGMLFIFDDEETRSFWMKNTFIDLDIGFFDSKKVLVDIQTMKAVKSEIQQNIPSYLSAAPAKYALEVPAGWFKTHNIKLGSKLGLK